MTRESGCVPCIMDQLMQHILCQGTMPLKDREQVSLIEADEIEGKDSKDSDTEKKRHLYQLFGRERPYWTENVTAYLVHFISC